MALRQTTKHPSQPVREQPPAPVVIDVLAVTKAYDMWATPSARLLAPALRRIAELPVGDGWRARLNAEADRRHRTFHALHPTSLQIRKGESWGIIGVNGSGKSTLLKMISGNLRPSAGRIEIEGKVAILDFSSGLNPDFTGRENVFLKAAIFGIPRKIVEQRFDDIAAFADIGDFMELPVKTYSSGMMARLGFAILAHVDADILITDEALAVGDAFFVQKCMRWIREFIERGTFLMVSHSINDIISLCEKAVWLENGRVRAIGSADKVANDYISSSMIRRSRRFQLDQQPEQSVQALAEEAAVEAAVTAATAAAKEVEEQHSEGAVVGTAGGTYAESPGGTVRTKAEVSQPHLAALAHAHPPRKVRDPRLDYINRSPWRNDIKVPPFDPSAKGIGVGGARIEDVLFEDLEGRQLSWIIGGETVRITIVALAEQVVRAPILGFQLKDRLGQAIFGDNTYLTTLDSAVSAAPGERIVAQFEFQMPLLPVGDYVMRAAIADGNSESENAMLHIIDNALQIMCTTHGVRHGLVCLPMERVTLKIVR